MVYDNGGAVFNVRSTDYNGGAAGDGVANDAQAFLDALAAADAVGGTMFIPAGEYLIDLGDPRTDPLWTTISSTVQGGVTYAEYAYLRITNSGTSILADNGAHVRVVARHIFQTDTDTEPTQGSRFLYLGGSSNQVQRNRMEGGRWTWEAGAPAVLQESNPGFNGFSTIKGNHIHATFRDIEFDGFPQGILEFANEPGYAYGKFTHNLYENVRVVNYGGASDMWLYPQGGTTVRGGMIRSQRTYQSHGMYFGLDRPGIVVEGVEFRGIKTQSKYPIDFRGVSGDEGRGPKVVACSFYDCNPVQAGAAVQGDTYKPYVEAKFIGCTFDNRNFAGGGISFIRARGAELVGCTFIDSVVTIGPECEGVNLDDTCEFQGRGQVSLYGSAAGNTIRGRWMDPETLPISITGTGRGNVVENVHVSVNLADPKYTTAPTPGTIAPPEAAMWLNPVGGSCDVRGGRVSLRGMTAYSSIGIRVLDGSTNVSIHDVTFGTDSTTQGYAVVRVGAVAGPTRIARLFEERPTVSGVPVLLPNTNGLLLSGGANTTLLDNQLVCKLNGVTGVVRAERNLFGGVPDALDAGTVSTAQTPNAGPYREIRYTLGASITLNAPANPYRGARLRFVLVQDATGGRAVTFNAVYKVNWTPDTTAGKRNVIEFVFDGTNWNQVSAATGL